MKYCIFSNISQNSVFQPYEDLHFELFSGPSMVDLILDSRYERISSTLSVNSALNIIKMALLFVRITFKKAFSSRLRTSVLKLFSGPNHGKPVLDCKQDNV